MAGSLLAATVDADCQEICHPWLAGRGDTDAERVRSSERTRLGTVILKRLASLLMVARSQL